VVPGGVLTAAVAAVIVSYNSGRYLGPCLDSLEAEGVDRIVVIDNGSTDDSRRQLVGRSAAWIDSGSNLGYGRAANMGARNADAAGAEYLMICNPDLVIEPGAVAGLVAALEADSAVAIVGPRITNTDGTLYPSARTFPDMADAIGHGLLGLVAPNNRFTRRYRLLDWDHAARAEVDWVSGACFLVRRKAFDQVGGFDPAFFMYMEEVDLCWRVRRAGWKVLYEPAAAVMHVQGVSTDQHPYRMLAAHHRSMWIFARRTTTGSKRAVLPVVAVGLAARFAVACGRRRLSGPAGQHLLA
jgi:N-acetylglucosaminyl-diphospho-decaprenol L-rhamnosyltransferase